MFARKLKRTFRLPKGWRNWFLSKEQKKKTKENVDKDLAQLSESEAQRVSQHRGASPAKKVSDEEEIVIAELADEVKQTMDDDKTTLGDVGELAVKVKKTRQTLEERANDDAEKSAALRKSLAVLLSLENTLNSTLTTAVRESIRQSRPTDYDDLNALLDEDSSSARSTVSSKSRAEKATTADIESLQKDLLAAREAAGLSEHIAADDATAASRETEEVQLTRSSPAAPADADEDNWDDIELLIENALADEIEGF